MVHSVCTFLLLVPWLFATALAAASPVVNAITVSGNSLFTTREILSLLSSKPGLQFSHQLLSNDLQTVMTTYEQRGYYDTRISISRVDISADSGAVDIELVVQEGKQGLLGEVVVAGNRVLTREEILGAFETRPGAVLDQATLEQDIDLLLGRYESLGYPFAECRVEDIVRRDTDEEILLDIHLRIDEHEKMHIDEVRVEGNKETAASVIVRETRLASGEVFDPEKIQAIRPRLRRLNIFSDVSDPELYLRDKKGGLLIKVQEGNTNTFDGVVGYQPGISPGEPGFLTGVASVSMRNLFGTGRKLSFRWQREDRFSQEIGIRYLEPWVLGFPANLGGGFFQRKKDTTYVRRVFDLKGELMLTEDLSVAALFSTESVIPSDSLSARVFKSSTVTVGAELQYDTRDDLYSPTSGARYRADYQYGSKRISDIPPSAALYTLGNSTVQRFGVDADFFFTTFSRQVVAVGLRGRELRSGQLEESEMFRFGGMRTLRGYRENQFIGSRVVWTNTEYRLILARRSFLYGFIDTGYYFRPADDLLGIPASDEFKYGYGLGIQLETGLGLMGVSFALGEGDSFSTGKVHFGVINEF
ncbi:MAG: outer membrane protein assembly factor [Bacteroidota bacterium]